MNFLGYGMRAYAYRCHFVFLLFSKPDLGSEGFGDLLACIRDKNIPLQNMHFVVWNMVIVLALICPLCFYKVIY